jgi:hypothetical protein
VSATNTNVPIAAVASRIHAANGSVWTIAGGAGTR